MNHLVKIVLIAFLVIGQAACSKSDKQSSEKSGHQYVVKQEKIHKSLFFTGTIQPLHESTITVPFESVIAKMGYHYGQRVKKGEVVFTLDSAELQKQYNETLTDYLKAKDSYNVSQAKFVGTQELWKAGLLAKNNYLSEKSSVDTARVTLMQATSRLSEMLEKMDEEGKQNLSNLSLAEFDKVRQALTTNHNLIHLRAPEQGVLLYPPKTGEDKSERLAVGSSVKAGQVVALIGDLSGISVEIDVPEIDIDKIHPGMKATVTGVALGHEALHGEVVAVNSQASTAAGALPSFTAVVEVKTLTAAQSQRVKVGMSASIELSVDDEQQLQVPVAAVKQDKGMSVVKVLDQKGKLQERMITTGSAQADKVIVLAGLQENETVVYD